MSALQSALLGSLPVGARGFDLNQPLTATTAPLWRAHGYTFVDRYIWRDHQRSYDLSRDEIEVILSNGLALSTTQHYAGDGWSPNGALGTQYGAAAVAAMNALGLPGGLTIWCDLEGCADGASVGNAYDYADAWKLAVGSGGFMPGLYVGEGCVLGPVMLARLAFPRYRRALNLNVDQYPTGRGFCVFQHEAKPEDIPVGIAVSTADFDTDTVFADTLGGLPTALMPGEVFA